VTKLKRAWYFCLHKLWLLAAVSIVLLATTVSLLRFGLPYAEGYKTNIEQLIKERYGADVRIGSLSADWQSTGPTLLLQQLVVKDNNQQPLIKIVETRVGLDFWGSLTSLQLKAEHFELSGLSYQLDSQVLLSQSDSKSKTETEPLLGAVEKLLFQQLKNFTLVDSHLTLTSQYTPPIRFDIKRLAWHNQDERHQGSGEVAIAGVTNNTLSFILDLHGESLSNANGQLYLSSSDLDVLPWLQEAVPQSKKLERADINFQAWGDISNGGLTQLQIALAENSLVWNHDQAPQQLTLGQGQLIWKPLPDGWQLLSSPLTLTSGNERWPDLQLQLTRQAGAYTGTMQQLRLAAAVPLAQLFAEDISGLQEFLAYKAEARFTQLAVKFDDKSWFASADFIDLTTAPVGDVPGLDHLTGHVSASSDYIHLNINGRDGKLAWGEAFSRDTAYQSLFMDVEAVNINEEWRLQVSDIKLRHPDLALDGELQLTFSEEPSMTLLAELRGVPVADAKHFFPTRHMGKETIDFLVPALISGNIPVARVLWQGKFASYPFKANDGIFQAIAQVENAEFSFAPDWPSVKKLSAELIFENANMFIKSRQGELFDLALADGVTAEIPDLFHADNLYIDIKAQTDAAKVTALMLASPLSNSLGNTLDHLGVSGPVTAKIRLDIGLNDSDVLATGDVDFLNSEMAIRAPAVAVNQLQGRLHFENERISSQQLQFVTSGIPMTATLHGEQQPSHYAVKLQAKGEYDLGQILGLVSPAWQTLGDGQAVFDWDFSLSLPEEGFAYSSKTLVDLAAAKLALPMPFGKEAADSATVLIEANGSQIGSAFELSYGDQLHFQAHLDQASGKIDEALLTLGEKSSLLRPGFFIEANLAQADFSEWISFINTQLSTEADTEQSVMPSLTQVNAKVDTLHLFDDVDFHQVDLVVTPQAEKWQLQLKAQEAVGELAIANDLAAGGIDAHFERLQLVFADAVAAKAQAEAEKLARGDKPAVKPEKLPNYKALERKAFDALTPMNWLADLPAIRLSCDECVIGDFQLGQVEAKTAGDGEQWQLEQFDSRFAGHHWQASGYWQRDEALGQTHLNASLKTKSLGALLAGYDISSSIQDSPAEMQLQQFTWQGAPFQFNRLTLNGALSWQISEGSLTDFSDGGTRVFSLLSLDSLVRKLRLDFSDVFAKGFFFNKMTGSMLISEGISHTNDTFIDGVAGDLELKGTADLVAHQLDYKISFSPKVTSSLPVILAWMVNPVSGVAAYALDEMFQSAEVISKINFEVTGDFDYPDVVETKRSSKQVPLPEPLKKPEPVQEVLPEEQQMKEAQPLGGDELLPISGEKP
jgi:uncharacterized protein (TIGR02099 family)